MIKGIIFDDHNLHEKEDSRVKNAQFSTGLQRLVLSAIWNGVCATVFLHHIVSRSLVEVVARQLLHLITRHQLCDPQSPRKFNFFWCRVELNRNLYVQRQR